MNFLLIIHHKSLKFNIFLKNVLFLSCFIFRLVLQWTMVNEIDEKNSSKNIDLMDSVIADGAISDSHLRMLIEQITVTEKGGKLTINFMQGGSHRIHFDYYNENGEMIDRDYECGVREGDMVLIHKPKLSLLIIRYKTVEYKYVYFLRSN